MPHATVRRAVWGSIKAGFGVFLAFSGAGAAIASSDVSCDPTWTTELSTWSACESTVMLKAGNETRVNLQLLLGAFAESPVLPRVWYERDHPDLLGGPFYPWYWLVPRPQPGEPDGPRRPSPYRIPYAYGEGSLCQSSPKATEEFLALIAGAPTLSQVEKEGLRAARIHLHDWCASEDAIPLPETYDDLAQSPQGKALARYLQGAQAFYREIYDEAGHRFAALAETVSGTDPVFAWVSEASTYLKGRVALAQVQSSSHDAYGYFKRGAHTDFAALAAARNYFIAYLQAYPQGAYAHSAQGLLRRLQWLEGDVDGLAQTYHTLIGTPQAQRGVSDGALVSEIESYFLREFPDARPDDPVMRAVIDLQHMRTGLSGGFLCCGPEISEALTLEALEAQRPLFASTPDLYTVLLANHALTLRHDPQAVLALIPDESADPSQGPIPFTLRMLRAMALEDLGQAAQAEQAWLTLLPQATLPGQRALVELHYVMHLQQRGFQSAIQGDSPAERPIKQPIGNDRSADDGRGDEVGRGRNSGDPASPGPIQGQDFSAPMGRGRAGAESAPSGGDRHSEEGQSRAERPMPFSPTAEPPLSAPLDISSQAARSGFAKMMEALETPLIRQRLLIYTADADFLRGWANNSAVPANERNIALFVLLYKEITGGRGADFVRDLPLVARAPVGQEVQDEYAYYSILQTPASPPLDLFTKGRDDGGYACPSLLETAKVLDQRPDDPVAAVCVAEFVRLSGLDDFFIDQPVKPDQLGGGESLFERAPYNRHEVYQALIADQHLTADLKAYALYRAVRCYAPASFNTCGGEPVPETQRRDWFRALKANYPNSPWAQELKYYW